MISIDGTPLAELDLYTMPTDGERWQPSGEAEWCNALTLRSLIREVAEERANDYLAALGYGRPIDHLDFDPYTAEGVLGFPRQERVYHPQSNTWAWPAGLEIVPCFAAISIERGHCSSDRDEHATYKIPWSALWDGPGTIERALAAKRTFEAAAAAAKLAAKAAEAKQAARRRELADLATYERLRAKFEAGGSDRASAITPDAKVIEEGAV
jgi:hypothetical protein